MKKEKQYIHSFVTLLIFSLAAALLAPSPAGAWTSSYRSTSVHHYNSWDARYMQQQAISAQEEARREAGREKRREEVQKEREQTTREYLASKAAMREASRAAARAPRDYFYRKPGSTATSLAEGHLKLEVNGEVYFYDRGMFYRQVPGKFIVVPAPVGAVVDALPEGVSGAVYQGDADTYFHYFGTFFTEKNGKYEVVTPPEGTLVGYIPDGYTETQEGESVRYEFGGINYKQYFIEGVLVYSVVGA